MNTRYILHGGRLTGSFPNNQYIYDLIRQTIADGQQVAMCFAALAEEKRQSKLQEVLELTGLHSDADIHLVESVEDARRILPDVGLVLFHGGDVDRFFDIFQDAAELKELLSGKIVIGSSAGAFFLTLNEGVWVEFYL